MTKISIETVDQSSSRETYKNFHISIAVLAIGASLIADLVLGQFNSYLAAGFLAIWLLSQSSTKKSLHLVALIFSIISSKLTPFALLPVVILKRRWSLAFWMLTYSVALNLAAAGVIGLPLSDLLSALNATAAEHKLSVMELTNVKNQALVAMLGRFYLIVIDQTLPKNFVLMVVALASIIFGSALLKNLRANREKARSEFSLRDMSIAILISLILSPDTRTAHLVQLVVPVLLLSGWISNLVVKVMLAWTVVFVGFAGTAIIGVSGLEFIRSHSVQGMTLLMFFAVILLRPSLGQRWRYRAECDVGG